MILSECFTFRVEDHIISLVVHLVRRLELALDSVFSLEMLLLELCECIMLFICFYD